jgi:hypothetical protein
MKKHREIAVILTLRPVGSQENGSCEGSEVNPVLPERARLEC